uniref:60S ribosomal export protein NMD3 n=1 Tax=Sinocyclocheilus anshuiensis TaxID=1608454 RepID=A0A671NV83_9TELE
ELLALCLKKLKASVVRLIDAGFLWTEPHSKRIKMKLTIQKEVMNGAILQQVFVVEFVIQPQMCEDCHRVEAKDFWKAVVQVRQKVHAGDTCLGLKSLGHICSNSQQYIVWVKIIDFSFMPKIIRILMCLISVAEVDGSTFWRHPFSSLCSPRQLEEFIVMDIDIIRDQRLGAGAGLTSIMFLHNVIEVWGKKILFILSRVKVLFLNADLVLGFDFTNANINDEFLNKMNPHHVPDVVRQSQCKSIIILSDLTCGLFDGNHRQYTEFLEDLEEDEMLRKNVNIFRDASKIPVVSETDDDGAPRISLAEMEDLSLSDATGGAGAHMMTD